MDDDKLLPLGPDGILPLLEAHGFRSTPENIQKYTDGVRQIFEANGVSWSPENMPLIKEVLTSSFLETVKKHPRTREEWKAAYDRWSIATTPTPPWAAGMKKTRSGIYLDHKDIHLDEEEIIQGCGIAYTPENVHHFKQGVLTIIHLFPKPAGSRKAAYWHGPDGIEVLEPPLPRRSGPRRRQQQNGRTR